MATYASVELKESASEANSNTDSHIYHTLESAECDCDLFSTDTDLPGGMENPTYDIIQRKFGRPTSKPAAAFGSKENIVAESFADSTYDMVEHDASKESRKSKLVTDLSEKEITATEIPLYSVVDKRKKMSKLVDAKGNTNKAASVYDEIEKNGDTASIADLGYSQLNTSKHSSLHSCNTDANADDITEKPESNKQDLVNYSTFKQLVCIFLIAIVFVMVLICLVVLIVQVAELKQQISVLKEDALSSQQAVNLTNLMIELQDVDQRLGRTENRTASCLCNNSFELYLSELNSSLDNINSSLQTAIMQFTQKFAITSQELFINLSSLLLSENCSSFPSSSPSAYYWIRTTDDSIVRVYCDMERTCGGVEGGWMRVAELDMRDNDQECPNGLMLRNDSASNARTCVKNEDSRGCSSILNVMNKVSYSRVCGKVTGYQIGSTNAFSFHTTNSSDMRSTDIDAEYVDGVSITTNGNPREHIWTFAAALDQTGNLSISSHCPCNRGRMPPSFVNENYFCDTAVQDFRPFEKPPAEFYANKTLWSETVCGPSNDTCCTRTHPPWFYKALQQSTTDDIEIRLCRDEGSDKEDIAIESFEIYVQ